MSKKADDIQEPFTRRITKAIPGVIAQKGNLDPTYSDIYGGWQDLGLSMGVYYQDTIDLSGYANSDLTFYPDIGFNQIGVGPTITGTDGGELFDAVYVTTVPLTDFTSLWWWTASGSSPALPQFDTTAIGVQIQDSTQWETLLYCEQRLYARNTNVPGGTGLMQLIDRAQLGSLEPTAADKLFITRVVIPLSNIAPYTDFTSIAVPPSRVGFIGTMVKESDLEYMMRLKRSYELANQV
jgi:hypothetical protein